MHAGDFRSLGEPVALRTQRILLGGERELGRWRSRRCRRETGKSPTYDGGAKNPPCGHRKRRPRKRRGDASDEAPQRPPHDDAHRQTHQYAGGVGEKHRQHHLGAAGMRRSPGQRAGGRRSVAAAAGDTSRHPVTRVAAMTAVQCSRARGASAGTPGKHVVCLEHGVREPLPGRHRQQQSEQPRARGQRERAAGPRGKGFCEPPGKADERTGAATENSGARRQQENGVEARRVRQGIRGDESVGPDTCQSCEKREKGTR